LFIHQTLLEAFTCGITEIDVASFGRENQRLLKPNIFFPFFTIVKSLIVIA